MKDVCRKANEMVDELSLEHSRFCTKRALDQYAKEAFPTKALKWLGSLEEISDEIYAELEIRENMKKEIKKRREEEK